jgi:carboxypeptidase PM20D1
MRRMFLTLCALAAAVPPIAPQALAKPRTAAADVLAEARALDLAKRFIALRTVRGVGNKTPEAMEIVRQELVAAGWSNAAIEITPHGRGRGPAVRLGA